MADPSLDYLHAQSPTAQGQQPHWPRDQRPPAIKYTKRFDSGVANLDHDGQTEISIRPMAVGGPPQTHMSEYDYAKGGHLYEELPGKYPYMVPHPSQEVLDSPLPKPIDDQQSSSWPSTVSDHSRAAIINNNNSESRKRNNPLYDAIQHKYPSPLGNAPPSRHKQSSRHIVCLCVLTIIALLVAVISLAVAIYVLMQYSPPSESPSTVPSTTAASDNLLLAQYQHLQIKFKELVKNYTELYDILHINPANGTDSVTLATKVARNMMVLNTLGTRSTSLQDDISQLKIKVLEIDDIKGTIQTLVNNISDNSVSINTVYGNITTQLSQSNSHIQQQLLNISKMEGPRGLQGVGNLSVCTYESYSQTLDPAIIDPTATSWNPPIEIIRDNVVMSSTCSVEGGTQHNLEIQPNTGIPNSRQYRCRCAGTTHLRARTCYLHVWMCPRLS